MSRYEAALAYLSALEVTAGWDLKLERMRAALARRGHPEAAWPAVHIAGTNGKGSTAAMVDAVLGAAGYRTGLYTSPHLVDFAERIRAGGRTIPRETVADLVAELRVDLERGGIGLTHFEFATLIACEWFRRIGIDVGVIEVGLGGRLDATNLVHPAVTAITSIGHDHEEYLGHDLRSIAAEKAGILKPGVPVVVGSLPPAAAEVIVAHASQLGAPVLHAGSDVRLEEASEGLTFRGGGMIWDRLRLGLPGAFQRRNATVALGVLAALGDRLPCSPGAVRAGLAAVRWPGRLAVLGGEPLVVLDGAHNPEGVQALVEELPEIIGQRRMVLVFAVMADKDWRTMLAPLAAQAARVCLTRVGRRGADPDRLAATIAGGVPVETISDARQAVRAALDEGPGTAVVVTGSLYLVGEAYRILGGAALFEPWNAPGADGTEAPLWPRAGCCAEVASRSPSRS